MRIATRLVLLIGFAGFTMGQIFINEIDYDQPGTDASEYLELAAPAGTYNNVSVELVNGNNDGIYQSAELGTLTFSDESGGYGFYVVGVASVPNVDTTPAGWPSENLIQNGAPDAVVLKIGGTIVDAVAYEGDMTDTDGNLMESGGEDIAMADLILSISRLGMDGSPWAHVTSTPGEINIDQTFDPGANFNPIAIAGDDQTTESGATITLDGSSSYDTDGTIESYLWEQVSGTAVTLTNANTSVASFTVPDVDETSSWAFSLTVTDDEGATGVDEVEVTVYISATMTIAEARTQAIGALVTVNGLVNSVNFSSSGTEHTFEDETAGIDLYFSGGVLGLEIGDEITVTGSIAEYNGKLEVIPASAGDVVVNSTGNILPDPQLITVAELAVNGESYESELIRIDNVSNTGTGDGWPSGGNNANINITDNGSDVSVMRIDKETEIDGTQEPLWPIAVIGVVSEFSGTYQILPRMLSDFVSDIVVPVFQNETHSPEFVTSINQVEISVDIIPGDDEQTITAASIMYGIDGTMLNESEMWLDAGNTWMGDIPAQAANSFLEYQFIATTNDGSEFTSYQYEIAIASTEITEISTIQADPESQIGQVVTIEGVITIGSGLLRDDRTTVYIQDGSGHGINLYDYDIMELNRGDLVTAVGIVDVFVTTVELTYFSYQLISTGNELPDPVMLTPGEANQAIWEGTLVSIDGVITDVWTGGGGTTIDLADEDDTTHVRIWETTGIDIAPYSIGTEWSFMGVGSQYNNAFQMLAAYAGDIVSTSEIKILDPRPHTFALNAAYPNPFNPTTTLSWTLEEVSELSIRVVDVRGREVAILADGVSNPGYFSINWDASEYASGVYFIQLTTPKETAIQKVMLLK